jgi:hypothetical protein
MRTQFIPVPAEAIAYKFADPTEGARWLTSDSEVDEIRREDLSLITDIKSGVEAQADWAAVVVAVDGGYMAFESICDYNTWARQN